VTGSRQVTKNAMQAKRSGLLQKNETKIAKRHHSHKSAWRVSNPLGYHIPIHYGRNRNLELTGVNLTRATTYPRRSGMKIMETRKLQGDAQKQGTRTETQTRKIDRWVYPTYPLLLAQMAHGSRTGRQGLCSRGGHKRGERRRNRNKQEAAFCAR
jgi:hypothetical protein